MCVWGGHTCRTAAYHKGGGGGRTYICRTAAPPLIQAMHDNMKEHLELEFHGKNINDETVLCSYPVTVRRRIMR